MSYPPPIPQPVSPLAYGNPYDRRGRPGILTAMGVMSIVVASISILAGLWGALMSFGFLAMSMAPPMAFPPPVATAASAGVTVSGGLLVTPEEDSIDAVTSDMIADVLSRRRAMSEQQQAQLKALLEQAGKRVFAVTGDGSITPQFIRSNVTASGGAPGVGGKSGSTYYLTGAGRVEVYDDHALFRPTGSADIVSVTAPPPPTTGATFSTQSVFVGPGGVTVTPPTPPTTAPATLPAMMMPRVKPFSAGLVLGVTAAGELLAVFLLISGIMVLRDARSARKLHWIYVILKLPLVVIAAAAWIWMFQQFFAGVMGMTPGAAPPPRAAMMTGMAIWPVVFAVLAAAYPIALIFVLMSRAVRDYYSPVIE